MVLKENPCITSSGNAISIEQPASAVFVGFWLDLPFKERQIFYGLVKNNDTKLYPFQNISPRFLLKI